MSVSRNIVSYMLVYIARFLYLAYSSYGWRWCSQNFVTIYGTKNQSNKLTQYRNVSEVMNVWAIEILLLLLLLLLPFGSGQPKAKSRKKTTPCLRKRTHGIIQKLRQNRPVTHDSWRRWSLFIRLVIVGENMMRVQNHVWGFNRNSYTIAG